MQEFLKKIIKEAGQIALGYYKNGVSHTTKSSPGDLLTEADIVVDKFLVNKIKEKYPEHGIISEEMAEVINPNAEYVWVMDPIDGTRNFAHHVPFWCTMIGITKNGQPYLGTIYDALHDELYFAEVGCGAYLNGQKIQVSNKSEVPYCFLSFSAGMQDKGSPYFAEEYPRYKNFMIKIMGDSGFWINNYGSVLSMCHLASGGIDAMVMCSGLYHDYLAGFVIATEAGAKFTNSYGEPWKKGMMDIVVANPKLHKELIKLF